MIISQVAVLGAGLMGMGIAGQIANAGVKVLLLDLKSPGQRPNQIAETALAKASEKDSPVFMSAAAAKLVTPGNFDDDLAGLGECDWIIEAVVEKLAVKHALYAKIDAARKPGSIVSSNTSTLPLKLLLEGQSEAFARDFLITHFFNPPRFMRLLELVRGPATRADAFQTLRDFADIRLGKGVVAAKDTPGFIANRIGVYFIQCAVNEAIDAGLTVEEADAISGVPFGMPKTGIYGLLDLIGLDTMPLVGKSLADTVAANDDYQRIFKIHPVVTRLLEQGYTGRKGKGGFYRMNRAGGGKQLEALDIVSGEYRPSIAADLPILVATKRDLKALTEADEPAGRFAKRLLIQTLTYAASLVPEIADDIVSVDHAMRLGYNWGYGPFELIDQLGADYVAAEAAKLGLAVPKLLAAANGASFYRVSDGVAQYRTINGGYQAVPRPLGTLFLNDVKLKSKPLLKNGSAAVWDIGDGILCFEFTAKANALDPQIFALLSETLTLVASGHKGLVIYNEGKNFSVGANIGLALFAANIAMWPTLNELIIAGQKAYSALRYAPFPVVGAPANMAVGGGCEILMHCDAVQAHAETYMGLVEVGVGVIPAWGGSKELLSRWFENKRRASGPIPAIAGAFETIATAQVSKSAANAKELLYLQESDSITMNRDRLLADAKAKCLSLVEGYHYPKPHQFNLPGKSGAAALTMAVDNFVGAGKATPHDQTVLLTLARVLTGGDADITDTLEEGQISELEREAFMALIKMPATVARIEHMLETGKPLRN